MRNTLKTYLFPAPEAGSILAIAVWALTVLSILALSAAKMASTQIKFSSFYVRINSSLPLAEAAARDSFSERQADETKDYDSRKELVKERKFDFEGGLGYSYSYADEGSRINLNTASAAILGRLAGLNEELAQEILKSPRRPFKAKEEVSLVEGMTGENFEQFKDLITVYGDGKININSAPEEILSVLGLGPNLIAAIVTYREQNPGEDGQVDTADDGAFVSPGSILPELRKTTMLSVEEEEQLLSVMGILTVKSDYPTVNISTQVNFKPGNNYSALIYPKERKILSWQEQ